MQTLPDRRTCDYEEAIVRVTSSGGFTLRKVFYTVPSRLIGHRLRVRLYDDRLEVFIGGTPLMTLPRGRPHPSGKHDQVVDYHHVIHALRRKPMALLNLVYRDQLFPREAYRRAFEASVERLPRAAGLPAPWSTCWPWPMSAAARPNSPTVSRPTWRPAGCPIMAPLRARFAPDPARVPHVTVQLAPLATYDGLLGAGQIGDAA